MKHKTIFTVLIILGAIFILMISLIGYGIYYFFFSNNMSTLAKGEYLCESTSPNGTYTVKGYKLVSSLSSDAIRCEAINNKTGKKRNIYFEYGRYLYEEGRNIDAEISWESDEVVVINGKRLNVKKDTYDWRKKN